MPIVLILAAVAALALAASSKTGKVATGTAYAQKRWVPVLFGDDAMTLAPGQIAEWHPTMDQTKLFGPRFPSYWSLNGYFIFDNGSGGFDKYKPDWQVPVKMVSQMTSADKLLDGDVR